MKYTARLRYFVGVITNTKTDAKHTEFFDLAWTKPDLQTKQVSFCFNNTSHHWQKSPRLLQMVQHFNEVTWWVAATILMEKKVRNRAKIMDIFIQIAQVMQ